jgi:hypothetical protein
MDLPFQRIEKRYRHFCPASGQAEVPVPPASRPTASEIHLSEQRPKGKKCTCPTFSFFRLSLRQGSHPHRALTRAPGKRPHFGRRDGGSFELADEGGQFKSRRRVSLPPVGGPRAPNLHKSRPGCRSALRTRARAALIVCIAGAQAVTARWFHLGPGRVVVRARSAGTRQRQLHSFSRDLDLSLFPSTPKGQARAPGASRRARAPVPHISSPPVPHTPSPPVPNILAKPVPPASPVQSRLL